MTDLFLNMSVETVDWSRAQFALTAIYHWLFVPLTLGLALIMGIMETCFYRTNKWFWRDAARFWQKLFGINFAMGVATGIILEFEFGTNWSNYSWLVGDIFGAPLAIEGIVAFFLEATFVGVMFFGWERVSTGFHLASTWLTGLGATISAWWILVANAWMQYPVGQAFNLDTMRNEMTSFAEVALSPFAIDKFFHTVISSWIIGAIFVVAVSCYLLLRNRKHTVEPEEENEDGEYTSNVANERKLALKSIRIASIVGLVASLLAMHTGDHSAYMVAKVQPMKLAAMEALYDGGNGVGLTGVALLNPFEQPDYASGEQPPMKIEVPNMLSLLATRQLDGYVPGINDIIKGGWQQPDGTTALSLNEKIRRGKAAIQAISAYRKADKQGDELEALDQKGKFYENMQYLGYGYVSNAEQTVPYIPICFWAFRVMVGLGTLFLLFFAVMLFVSFKKDIQQLPWLQWAAMAMLPLGYIASEAGWLVAEFGRQPWTIQDMLPTWVGVSDIQSSSVILTFFIFLVLFTLLLAVEINIMCKAIKKGPEFEGVILNELSKKIFNV